MVLFYAIDSDQIFASLSLRLFITTLTLLIAMSALAHMGVI